MKVSQEFINTDESATNKSDDNDGHGYKWIADTTGNELSNVNSSKGPAHTGTFQRALKSVLSWAQIMPYPLACSFLPQSHYGKWEFSTGKHAGNMDYLKLFEWQAHRY